MGFGYSLNFSVIVWAWEILGQRTPCLVAEKILKKVEEIGFWNLTIAFFGTWEPKTLVFGWGCTTFRLS